MSNKQIPEEVLQKALDYADIIDKTDLNINMVAYDAWLTGYKAALHPPQQGSAVVYVPVEIKNDNDCPKIGRKVIIMRSNGTTRTNTWNNTLKNHYKAMGVTRWLKPVALSSLLPAPGGE